MTDQELEQRLRSWYQAEIPVDLAAPADLRSRVVAIPRPSSQPWRGSGHRRWFTLLAAAALTGMIVGTALIGGQPDRSVVPPSDAPSAAPSPDVQPTAFTNAGRIVYTRRVRLENGEGGCTTQALFCEHASVVISNADGSDERELVPGPSYLVAASADGSKLLVGIPEDDRVGLFLTDASGSSPQRLHIPCEAPCYEDGDGAFAFSPDGSRIAFRRTFAEELEVPPYQIDTPLIAIMDLTTGTIDELESTLGFGASPGWSPDGSRLVFGNHVVDADGSNFQQIAPADLFTNLAGGFSGLSPSQWSPDGSLIVFASFNETLAPPDYVQRLSDIYVVRPDGTGLERLTTDTVPPIDTTGPGDFGADFPAWTRTGRITFTRYPMPPEIEFELWVMDPDGSNATRLDPSDAVALTALGCVRCSYPTLTDFDLPNRAYWIPAQ